MTQLRTDGHADLSEHAQLVSLLQSIDNGIDALGNALNAVQMGLRDISEKMATQTSGISSVEVKSSTRGVDVVAKGYVGSDISVAGAAAVAEYFRVVDMVDAELAFRKAAI